MLSNINFMIDSAVSLFGHVHEIRMGCSATEHVVIRLPFHKRRRTTSTNGTLY